MLENIAEYYKKADGKTKKKILACIFSEKLVLEKGKKLQPTNSQNRYKYSSMPAR